MGDYGVNADLSRFCKGLSIVELVEHPFFAQSHDVEHHHRLLLGKQAFLSHSVRFICDIHEVLLNYISVFPEEKFIPLFAVIYFL